MGIKPDEQDRAVVQDSVRQYLEARMEFLADGRLYYLIRHTYKRSPELYKDPMDFLVALRGYSAVPGEVGALLSGEGGVIVVA